MTAHLDPDFASLDVHTRKLVERGIITASTPPGGLTPLQRRLMWSFGTVLLGIPDFDPSEAEPLSAPDLAAALAHTPERTRQLVAQLMVTLELVLRPLPTEVCERVASYARALHVDEGMVDVARDYAHGALGLALKDLKRNGYFHDFGQRPDVEATLHVHAPLSAPFENRHHDEELYDLWCRLERSPEGSLGHGVARFYRSRGFTFPGHEDSVSPTLAQHDFVHVLGDYGAVIDSEIETFAMISGSIPDPTGFSWLAGMVGLFETAFIPSAAGGVLEADPGHLSHPGMCLRLADALRRGRLAKHDLMYGVDYFDIADRPLGEVRDLLGFERKDVDAIRVGSPGVFERAGYTPWQLEHGDSALQPLE